MDRSSLYSTDGPFQLMHVGIVNLEFLGESATTPRYALLAIDMYSSKVYVYPTHSQKQLLKYMNEFYVEISKKGKKASNMRLQTGNEFQQKKIKDLNERCNVTKFTTSARGGKAFVAEQKIRELKKRMLKIKEISD